MSRLPGCNYTVSYVIGVEMIVALVLLVGGPVMADDTGLLSPTANDGVFLSAVGAYHDDNQDAKAQDHGDQHIYYNYHINIPPGSTIDGIKVILDACRKPGNEGYLRVELSWDAGLLSWTSSKTTDSFPQPPTYETKSLGDSTDTWGRPWTVSELSDSNFRVRITALFGDPTKQGWINLDWCPVRIYYTPNQPPNTPSNPSPADGAVNQSINVDLSWTGGDPDPGDTVTYDVYFEANDSSPDELVSNDQSGNTYDPGTLSYNTHYY